MSISALTMREPANPPDRLTTTRSICSPAISSAAWTALRIECAGGFEIDDRPAADAARDLVADAEDARRRLDPGDKAADFRRADIERGDEAAARAHRRPAAAMRGRSAAWPLSGRDGARSCRFPRRSCGFPAGRRLLCGGPLARRVDAQHQPVGQPHDRRSARRVSASGSCARARRAGSRRSPAFSSGSMTSIASSMRTFQRRSPTRTAAVTRGGEFGLGSPACRSSAAA